VVTFARGMIFFFCATFCKNNFMNLVKSHISPI
jgi:hypothetical protein